MEQQFEEQRQQLPPENDGLERDIRAVLGLDEPQEDEPAPDDGGKDEQRETTDAAAHEDQEQEAGESDSEPLIDIGGEKVPLSQVQEWRKGYLRESDYTRKTQRLSERERELQSVLQQVAPMVHLQQLLQSNPAALRAFQTAYQAALQGQMPPARPGAPQTPQMPLQMPSQTDPEIQRLREVAADYQLDRQLAELRRTIDEDRRTFGLQPATDEEWEKAQEQVMREAVEGRIPDLRMAYRTSTLRDQLFQEGLRAVQSQQQAAQRSQQAKQAGSVLRGRGVPEAGVQAPQKPRSMEEATRRAFAELQASGGLFAQD